MKRRRKQPERFSLTYSGNKPVTSMPLEDFVSAITGTDGLIRETAKALGEPEPVVRVGAPQLSSEGGFVIPFETADP